ENSFFREDFRRVYLDDIGTIAEPGQVIERYIQGFMEAIDVEAVRRAAFRIVVDYAHATTSLVLPHILNKLGCQVVAINAAIDETKMSIPTQEMEDGIRQLSVICQPLQADLGVRLDVGGERVFLVDDQGQTLPGITSLAAVASLVLQAREGAQIAVPITQPRIFESLASRHGGSVIRIKAEPQALMVAATKEGVALAGDGYGSFVFPQFQPVVDGLMAIAKILELLATQKVALSEVVRSLPSYYIARAKVPCPWEMKGRVMRLLSEQYKEAKTRQIDGIRLDLGEEWVLVLPDADRPLFQVFAESSTPEQASGLAEKYAQVVRALQQ
ncbi:MAG: nucleotidyl transferase, partial [Chloroflexi bacterium]|nr:nucleotidyl transferase [Chloroflexota bacterium]